MVARLARPSDASFGTQVDFLAIDDRGRLLVVEAKPADELKGVAWSLAQVGVYAEAVRTSAFGESGALAVLDVMLA